MSTYRPIQVSRALDYLEMLTAYAAKNRPKTSHTVNSQVDGYLELHDFSLAVTTVFYVWSSKSIGSIYTLKPLRQIISLNSFMRLQFLNKIRLKRLSLAEPFLSFVSITPTLLLGRPNPGLCGVDHKFLDISAVIEVGMIILACNSCFPCLGPHTGELAGLLLPR